jgi:GNAT superfamily N-acetyltransferase
MKPYIIRDARENDLDDLLRLMADHAAYEQAPFNPEGKKGNLHKALFQSPVALRCFVIEMQGMLKGYCSFTIDYSTWDATFYLHMDCLYLDEDVRGLRIGSAVLEKLVDVARKNQCVNVQWQTPVFNTPAIQFYKKNGATGKEKVRFFLPLCSPVN